jgi:hypothetical protein
VADGDRGHLSNECSVSEPALLSHGGPPDGQVERQCLGDVAGGGGCGTRCRLVEDVNPTSLEASLRRRCGAAAPFGR